MKKMILLAGVIVASLGAKAQTSPYTGTTPQEGVFYLYNVQSGLWLQNNDSKCNFYQPLGNLGTRGLDINMVASGDGYLLGGGFGKNSLNSTPQTYFDSDLAADRVWVFEAGDASVSNGYTIHCGDTYLRTVKSTWGFPADNLFTQPLDDSNQRYYLEIPANSNVTDVTLFNTWQVVSKDERLAKMVAAASYDQPQEASWLVPNADFANRNERESLWTIDGFTRKGEQTGANWRMGNSIMQNTTPSDGIPDGAGMSIELTGLPNGIYHFNLQGFYLGGFYDEVAEQMSGGTSEQRVFYYANDTKKTLMSPFDEPMCQGHTTGDATYPLTVQKTYDVGEYTFPAYNSDVLASVVVNRYCGYLNDEIEVVVTDGTLTLGIIKEGDAVTNEWAVVDNFHLTYLGTDRQTIDEEKTCRVVPASDVTVTLNRTLSADYWNTFCVPFPMTADQVAAAFGNGTKITKLKSVADDVLYFEETTTIEAGLPCLIKPAVTTGPAISISSVTMTDTQAQSVGTTSQFVGTYSPVDLATDGTNLFLRTDGTLAKPTDTGNTMKGMRAYFQVPANSSARIVFDDGTTTAISDVMRDTKASDRLYDLGGRQKSQPKGIVIRDGKKYNIK